jgi:hypothetical protein
MTRRSTRLIAHLSPFVNEEPVFRVTYTIADADTGDPITGIRAIDPLTGTVLASNPEMVLMGERVITVDLGELFEGPTFDFE